MSVRVVAGLPTVVLVGVALLLGGCALLAMRAPPPDEPPPYTLRAAVEPARAALERGWPHTTPVHFRFLEARCAVGAAAVLVFEQAVPDERRRGWNLRERLVGTLRRDRPGRPAGSGRAARWPRDRLLLNPGASHACVRAGVRRPPPTDAA